MVTNPLRENVKDDLVALLSEFSCRRPISMDNRLVQDLGIGGDDADELLETIHEKFGTSFTDLEFRDYFPNDHEMLGERWFRLLGFQDNRKPLRVRHLLQVVQCGAWFEPPAEQRVLPAGNRTRRYLVRGVVALGMPVCWTLIAVAAGEFGFGLSPAASFALIGAPAAAVMAVVTWRRLPAN